MADSPNEICECPGYRVLILWGIGPSPVEDNNVDVEVRFPSGERFAATFFTLANIDRLMDAWSRTGECRGGLFFWADRPIVVRRLTSDVICETIAGLIVSGEFPRAFERLND